MVCAVECGYGDNADIDFHSCAEAVVGNAIHLHEP